MELLTLEPGQRQAGAEPSPQEVGGIGASLPKTKTNETDPFQNQAVRNQIQMGDPKIVRSSPHTSDAHFFLWMNCSKNKR